MVETTNTSMIFNGKLSDAQVVRHVAAVQGALSALAETGQIRQRLRAANQV